MNGYGYGYPRSTHFDFAECYARYVHYCSGDKNYLFGETKISIEHLLHRLQMDEGCEEGIWDLYPDITSQALVDAAYKALETKQLANGLLHCLDILQDNDLLPDGSDYFNDLRDLASRDVI